MDNIQKEMQTFVKIFPIHSYKELENEINSYLRRKGVELVSASSLDIHHAIVVFKRGGANG